MNSQIIYIIIFPSIDKNADYVQMKLNLYLRSGSLRECSLYNNTSQCSVYSGLALSTFNMTEKRNNNSNYSNHYYFLTIIIEYLKGIKKKGDQIIVIMTLKNKLSRVIPSQVRGRDGRFGSKVGQIGPKWDKSGAFSDQISVHLARGRQMH